MKLINCKCIAVILIGIVAISCFSCRKKWVENDARIHSQYVMDHLYDDTASIFFPHKYFSQKDVTALLANLKKECDRHTRMGGYKNDFYIWNTGSADEVLFTYEYQYNCGKIRFNLGYIIYWNSYELKSFRLDL